MVIVLVWAVSGPVFGFSDTWQLVINTGTTIATFLMVFLMQNTQNRDTRALQVKLDELIRAHEGADNQLLDLEEIEPSELEALQQRYEGLAEEARQAGGDKSTRELEFRRAMTAVLWFGGPTTHFGSRFLGRFWADLRQN